MATLKARVARGVSAALVLALVACTRPAPPVALRQEAASSTSAHAVPPPEKMVEIAEQGIAFLIPAAWSAERTSGAYVLSGPTTSPAYNTTVVVEAVSRDPAQGRGDLERLKAQLLKELEGLKDGKVLRLAPFQAGDVVGFRLETTFLLEGVARRKDQLLLDRGDSFLSLSCNAPKEHFAAGAVTWARVLETLKIAQPRAVRAEELAPAR